MEKLIYKKIADSVILIDLHNNYSIIAMIKRNYETKLFDVTYYIKENSIDMFQLVDEIETVSFNANYNTIFSKILKHVSGLLSNGSFNGSIEYYDYITTCFDRGNSLFEKERLNKGADGQKS